VISVDPREFRERKTLMNRFRLLLPPEERGKEGKEEQEEGEKASEDEDGSDLMDSDEVIEDEEREDKAIEAEKEEVKVKEKEKKEEEVVDKGRPRKRRRMLIETPVPLQLPSNSPQVSSNVISIIYPKREEKEEKQEKQDEKKVEEWQGVFSSFCSDKVEEGNSFRNVLEGKINEIQEYQRKKKEKEKEKKKRKKVRRHSADPSHRHKTLSSCTISVFLPFINYNITIYMTNHKICDNL